MKSPIEPHVEQFFRDEADPNAILLLQRKKDMHELLATQVDCKEKIFNKLLINQI